MVIVVTSNSLKDSVIKSVLNEYEIKSKEISPEDMNYGTDVIEPPYSPFHLKKLRESSGLHDICITTKCEDAIYSGKKIISKEGTEIPVQLDEFLNDFLTDEECEGFLEDLETYGFGGIEILRDGPFFKGINHIPSLYLRMCKDKKRVVQKIGTETVYFKVYDPSNDELLNSRTGFWDDVTIDTIANEILWFNSKSDESKVYGEPKYLSEIDAILTDNAIVEYQLGHFKAKGVPNYIITITGSIEEREDYSMDDFEEDLEKEFSEVTNEPGTALVLCVPSDGENPIQVNVHKIGEEMKEGSFLELSESNADRIYRIHKVPRERLGEGKSTGIASNRTEMLLKTYSRSTVGSLQKKMASYINKTIIKYEFKTNDHKVQYLPVNFDEENDVLDRGIKLLQNAAITLGEFINRFGEQFELHMDEDDEYYNVRFMNNQSLDTIVYGDDPVNVEEKLQDMINHLEEEMNPVE